MPLLDQLIHHIYPSSAASVYLASDVKRLSLLFKNEGESFKVQAFIDLLVEQLGDDRSLIIPAFTDHLQSGDTFNTNKSKPNIGALPKKVFIRKDYVRSSDPLHSAFIWGPIASLKFNNSSSFGENSLFYHMHKADTTMVFLDVDLQDSFTFVHYVEETLKVAYRKYYPLDLTIDGEAKRFLFHTRKPGYSTNLATLQEEWIERGIIKQFFFKGIPIMYISAQEAFSDLKKRIQKDGGKSLRTFSMMLFLKQSAKQFIKGSHL